MVHSIMLFYILRVEIAPLCDIVNYATGMRFAAHKANSLGYAEA